MIELKYFKNKYENKLEDFDDYDDSDDLEDELEMAGLDVKVNHLTTDQYPTPAKRPAYSVLDNYMLRLTSDFVFANWEDALAEYMKKVELLAPAGNFSCLKAAISSGANAVYLGGKNFSARAFAGNFDNEEIINKELRKYYDDIILDPEGRNVLD